MRLRRNQLQALRLLRDGGVEAAICPVSTIALDTLRALKRRGYVATEHHHTGVSIVVLTERGRRALETDEHLLSPRFELTAAGQRAVLQGLRRP